VGCRDLELLVAGFQKNDWKDTGDSAMNVAASTDRE